ncbi:MAG: uracil-DNA glycosylase [Desulfosudaceae bacterium]
MTAEFYSDQVASGSKIAPAAEVGRFLGEVASTLRFYAEIAPEGGHCSAADLEYVQKWSDPACLVAADSMAAVRRDLAECGRCGREQGPVRRINGAGPVPARLMFVSGWPDEAAGQAEGLFAGETGGLLSRMIKAMSLSTAEVYVTCAVKCRPSDGRPPRPDQAGHCQSFLEREIALVSPDIICALGEFSTRRLLSSDQSLERLRGRFHNREKAGKKPLIVPTWHPADILARPDKKRPLWDDLRKIMAAL